MTGEIVKVRDADTGESTMDVVRVPEGYSFQMAYTDRSQSVDPGEYISCIVKREDASRLADFLRGLVV